MKFCKDCAHWVPGPAAMDLCRMRVDPVRGQPLYAYRMREKDQDCGPQALLFHPRPPPPPQPQYIKVEESGGWWPFW